MYILSVAQRLCSSPCNMLASRNDMVVTVRWAGPRAHSIVCLCGRGGGGGGGGAGVHCMERKSLSRMYPMLNRGMSKLEMLPTYRMPPDELFDVDPMHTWCVVSQTSCIGSTPDCSTGPILKVRGISVMASAPGKLRHSTQLITLSHKNTTLLLPITSSFVWLSFGV